MSDWSLSPEARLLLLAINAPAESDRTLVPLREPGFDWDRALSLAIREKATAALRDLVQSLPAAAGAPGIRQQVEAVDRATRFRMLRLEQLLLGALDTLQREGIEVVLLKGAGLATTVYASFGDRPMYDLDLLVRPDDAVRAWNALRADGWAHDAVECAPDFYSSHYHLPPLDDPMKTGLALELHTAPTDGAVLLAAETIWRDARRIDVRGRSAFVPSPEHQVLHLAAHFAWTHAMASASWRTFRDLHQLGTRVRLDWDAIVRMATEARAGTACYWTFRLARSLAGVTVPSDVMNGLAPPRPDAVLRVLERHYAAALFPHGPAHCPSVWVAQLLWSAGMAPEWSGHGRARPWHRGQVWAETHGSAGPPSRLDRLRGHARRLGQWGRYVGALFGAPRRGRNSHPA